MPKAKKTNSGKWTCLAFSHYTEENGKKVRKYQRFTAWTKKEAELMASEFIATKEQLNDPHKITLGQAIDAYIDSSRQALSPSTIRGYSAMRRTYFQGYMDIPVSKFNQTMLQKAVNAECKRKSYKGKELSAKSIRNAYGLIEASMRPYNRAIAYDMIKLPKKKVIIKELPQPEELMRAFYGTDIELPVLLAMWLSFSKSEIRGLKKSTSVDGDFITIRSVVVEDEKNNTVEKDTAKVETRIRRHKMPERIKQLVNEVNGDILVPMAWDTIRKHYKKILAQNDLPDITFHDLRHVNASVMAQLNIPDKYAMERGGWKTEHVMKGVYQHTFSKERIAVDAKIDDYFNSALEKTMQLKMQLVQ